MFKKIFRPPSSATKKEPELKSGPDALAAAEYKPPSTEATSKLFHGSGSILEAIKRNDIQSLAQIPHIDPSDITIEDLDPYSGQQKVRRSKSFSFHPTPGPDPDFKLPRSKSVHFADQLAKNKGLRGGDSVSSGSPNNCNDVESSSSVYSVSLIEPSKEEVHKNINRRLSGIFHEGIMPSPETEDDTVSEDTASDSPGGDLGDVLRELSVDASDAPRDGEADSTSQDMWNETLELGDVAIDGSELYKKLSDVYLKYFATLPLESGDIGEVIQGLDSGIGETLQESRNCKSLLSCLEKRVKEVEDEAEVWKEKYFEADKDLGERQLQFDKKLNTLEKNSKASTEKAFENNKSLADEMVQLRQMIKEKDEEIKFRETEYKVLLQKNTLLQEEVESASTKLGDAENEMNLFKKRMQEIESSFAIDMKAKKNEIDVLKSENQDLKIKIAKKNEEYDNLNKSHRELGGELEFNQIQIKEIDSRNSKLKEALDAKEICLTSLQSQNTELKTTISLVGKKLTEVECEKAQLESIIDSLKSEASILRQENQSQLREKAEIEEKLSFIQNQIKESAEGFKDASTKNEEALERMNSLHAQLTSKEQQLKSLHEQITKLQAELSEKGLLVEKLGKEVNRRRAHFKTCFEAFQKVSWSNRFMVDSSRKLLKSTYEALASVFLPESASEYAQAYYELARIRVVNPENQIVVSNLSLALVSAIRQMVKLYAESRDTLMTERLERKNDQKTSMAAMTKMARYYALQRPQASGALPMYDSLGRLGDREVAPSSKNLEVSQKPK